MEWYQFFMLLTAYIATYWFSNREIKYQSQATDRKMDAIRDSFDRKVDAIQLEIKDFHGRLCAIEERRKCKEGE